MADLWPLGTFIHIFFCAIILLFSGLSSHRVFKGDCLDETCRNRNGASPENIRTRKIYERVSVQGFNDAVIAPISWGSGIGVRLRVCNSSGVTLDESKEPRWELCPEEDPLTSSALAGCDSLITMINSYAEAVTTAAFFSFILAGLGICFGVAFIFDGMWPNKMGIGFATYINLTYLFILVSNVVAFSFSAKVDIAKGCSNSAIAESFTLTGVLRDVKIWVCITWIVALLGLVMHLIATRTTYAEKCCSSNAAATKSTAPPHKNEPFASSQPERYTILDLTPSQMNTNSNAEESSSRGDVGANKLSSNSVSNVPTVNYPIYNCQPPPIPEYSQAYTTQHPDGEREEEMKQTSSQPWREAGWEDHEFCPPGLQPQSVDSFQASSYNQDLELLLTGKFSIKNNTPLYILVFSEENCFQWTQALWNGGSSSTVRRSPVQPSPPTLEGQQQVKYEDAGHVSLPRDAHDYVCFEVVDHQPVSVRTLQNGLEIIPRKERPSTATKRVFLLLKKGKPVFAVQERKILAAA